MKLFPSFPSAPFKRNRMELVAPGPKGSPESTPSGAGDAPGMQPPCGVTLVPSKGNGSVTTAERWLLTKRAATPQSLRSD